VEALELNKEYFDSAKRINAMFRELKNASLKNPVMIEFFKNQLVKKVNTYIQKRIEWECSSEEKEVWSRMEGGRYTEEYLKNLNTKVNFVGPKGEGLHNREPNSIVSKLERLSGRVLQIHNT